MGSAAVRMDLFLSLILEAHSRPEIKRPQKGALWLSLLLLF